MEIALTFVIYTVALVGVSLLGAYMPYVKKLTDKEIHLLIAMSAGIFLGILFFLRKEFVQLFEVFSQNLLLVVMGIVVLSGILICLVSTYFVVGKLVSLTNDELYY